MSTTTNHTVVLGLDIPKTKKAIAEDLKKVLKAIRPETIPLALKDTGSLTRSIAQAIQNAFQEAFASLSPPEIPLEEWETYVSGIQNALSDILKKADQIPDLKPLQEVWTACQNLSSLYPATPESSSAIEALITASTELEDSLNRLMETWDTVVSALSSAKAPAKSEALSGISADIDNFLKKLEAIPGNLLEKYNIKNSGGFDKTISSFPSYRKVQGRPV